MNSDFDAIVVGSGVSGGWAAKELTEKGLKVLVLERGRDVQHSTDYRGEHTKSWHHEYYGMPDRERVLNDYPIQSDSYAFSPSNEHFWNNDRLNPYIQTDGKPFSWKRADVVGGRSLLWGRQTYRWSAQDFKANEQDGHGIPWPVNYDDIAPWYSYVEKFAGISGQKEGWDHLPDSEFLPPMDYYELEKTIKKRISKKLDHIDFTIGRCAVLTEDHQGRAACHYCGPCQNGCSTGSYFSSQSSTLPAAQATGNLTLKPNQVVSRLLHDDSGKKITAVQVVDTQTGQKSEYKARIFFLCASTVASTQILLNSRSEKHPNGLANKSGALGKYVMDHAMLGHFSMFVDHADKFYQGSRPNGIYIPRFRNIGKDDGKLDFVRGYGFQGNMVRPDWQATFAKSGFGADYKESLRTPAPMWVWAIGGFIECLPYASNQVTLHASKTDRFGVPQVLTSFEWGDNELKLAEDSRQQAKKIFHAAGAVHYNIGSLDSMSVGGAGIHEMGTARMGNNPQESVLNKHNQAHEVSNLFVTDGSFMTSASCVNPSLTYMAFTARACDYAVTQLAEGQI